MNILTGLCLFGLIGPACGDAPAEPLKEPVRQIIVDTSPYYRETPSGDYLAGIFAQNRQDWGRAEDYFSRVLAHDPGNIELQRRAMILAIGAGEISRAIAKARKIVAVEPGNELALLVISLEQFSTGDYQGVVDTLNKMEEGNMADLIRPVLLAWAQSALKQESNVVLNQNHLHLFHAFLIADYLGNKDKLPALAALTINDSNMDFYSLDKIAHTLYRNGFTEQAEELYEKLAIIEPNKANLTERLGNLKDESKLTPPVAGPAQGAAEAFFDMARTLYRDGSDDSAKVFVRMAMHLNPDLTEAKLVLAGIMVMNEQIDQAITLYQSIPSDSPLYLEAQRQAATLLTEIDRSDEAIALLEKFYKDEGDLDSLVTIGDIYRQDDDFPRAIAAYNRAEDAILKERGVKKIPEEYWVLPYVRGMAYERNGQLAQSEKDLLLALQYRPNHPHLLNYLGYSWADQGKNLDQAIEMLEKAASLAPEDGYIADSVGWALFKAGRIDEAVAPLEKAVTLLPYDPEINNHLGDIYWHLGRKTEARYQWERAANNSKDETESAGIRLKISEGLPPLPPQAEGVKAVKNDAVLPDEKDKPVRQ